MEIEDPLLRPYLSQHTAIGTWKDRVLGVPLESTAYLAPYAGPDGLISSVRAVVLRDQTVLMVHSTVPLLTVGGRREQRETLDETVVREAAEESGWIIDLIGPIGFVRTRHLDLQRPDWNRPSPDWIDPVFAAEATEFVPDSIQDGEEICSFVPVSDVEVYGIEEINRAFLTAAMVLRDE